MTNPTNPGWYNGSTPEQSGGPSSSQGPGKLTLPEVIPLFATYYKAHNYSWGHRFHCEFEDSNLNYEFVKHSWERACKDGTLEEIRLFQILCSLSRTQRYKITDQVDKYLGRN